jgi:hypothetical protein
MRLAAVLHLCDKALFMSAGLTDCACCPIVAVQSILDTMQSEQVKRAVMVLASVLTPFAK